MTTGAPGQVAVGAPAGMRFVQVTRSGFQLGETVKLGEYFECSAVALRPNGAGVIVGTRFGRQLVAAMRDPGGTWSAPVVIAEDSTVQRDGFWYQVGAEAAVSDRGDIIVAFKETDYGSTDALDRIVPNENVRSRLRVVRRAAGGAFGAPEQIGKTSKSAGSVHAGIAATGEAVVAFTTVEGRPPHRVPVEAAIAPPGGPFGSPVHVADARWLTPPILDVAPDGRALVVAVDAASVRVAERAPGGGFATAAPVGAAADGPARLSAELGDDGAAAVAWHGTRTGRTQVVTRAAGGAFTAPVAVANGSPADPDDDPFYSSETYFGTLSGSLVAALTFADRPELVLTADARAGLPLTAADTPQLGLLALAGGPLTVDAATPLFGGADTGPLVLADGTPALIWADDLGDRRYRLRMAAQGVVAAPADPPAPRVTFGAPRSRSLDELEPLRLPVRCSAACDVQAWVDAPFAPAAGRLQLKRAGRGELQVQEIAYAAPVRRGPVRIRIATGAPGALHPQVRTLTVRIARSARVPFPVVTKLRARRAGKRVVVTFTADRTGSDLPLMITGDATRAGAGEPLAIQEILPGGGKRSYRVTLPARTGLKWVAVRYSFDIGPGATTRAKIT